MKSIAEDYIEKCCFILNYEKLSVDERTFGEGFLLQISKRQKARIEAKVLEMKCSKQSEFMNHVKAHRGQDAKRAYDKLKSLIEGGEA